MTNAFTSLTLNVEPPPVEVESASTLVRCGGSSLVVEYQAPTIGTGGKPAWVVTLYGSPITGTYDTNLEAVEVARVKVWQAERARLARLELDRLLAEDG